MSAFPSYSDSYCLKVILYSIITFIIVVWWFCRPKNLPPGPWSWPLFGYLPTLILSCYRTGLPPHEILARLSHKYGAVYSMHIGRKLVIVLNDYPVVKEAFRNQDLNNRPNLALFKDLGLGEGIFQASGEAWKHQRRFTLKTLRSFGVGKNSFEENISKEVTNLAAELSQLREGPFDPAKLINNATSNVICQVVFGQRFEYNDPNFIALLDSLAEIVRSLGSGGLQMFFPIAKYVQPSVHKCIVQNIGTLNSFIEKMVESHQQEHRDINNPRDYIDVYLNEIHIANTTGLKSVINRQNLLTTILDLFAAGTETTATAIRWAILYLMAYTEVQGRIHRELDSVVGRNRRPGLADKPNLPFTSAFILEVQRIASVSPIGTFHFSAEETTLAGYTIPKSSIIVSNLWSIHHDQTVWDKPEEFNPDRFLDEDGVLQEKDELIPFSVGRRACIGEHLAKMELYIFLTHLLHQFIFSRLANSLPVSLKGINGVTRFPEPFLVRIAPREHEPMGSHNTK